jgi:hypothetical protein
MKAVRQIIDYLCREGVLGDDDLAALAGGGFVGWDQVFQESQNQHNEPGIDDRHPAAEHDARGDEHDDRMAVAPRRPRRGASIIRKGLLLDEKGLLRRLHAAVAPWARSLTGLVRLARRVAPGDDWPSWQEAAVVLRNAELGSLQEHIARGLGQRDPGFDLLWESLAMAPYRTLVDEPGLHGPAVSGYRAILAAKDRAHLGRHSKLLRHPEVACVYNLRLAQRKTLAAMGPIFRGSRHLFDQAFTRAADPLAYWTFVLLHSAQRGSRGRRPAPDAGEHHPARELPDDALWLRAWEAATILDSKAVTPFLIELHKKIANRPSAVADALWQARFEMDGNDRGFVEAWAFGLQPADMSHPQHDQSAIARRLDAALLNLRQTVEHAGQLSITTDPEGPARFEAFLRSIFMLPHARYGQTVAAHFGHDWELFCSKAWDRSRWG